MPDIDLDGRKHAIIVDRLLPLADPLPDETEAALDGRIAQCRTWADEHGLDVLDVCIDRDVDAIKALPASVLRRPALVRALGLLDRCDAVLVTASMDRISPHRGALEAVAAAADGPVVALDGTRLPPPDLLIPAIT